MRKRVHPLYAPPKERLGILPGGLALLAHVLLIAALAWGIQWREHSSEVISAELWLPADEPQTQPLTPQLTDPAVPASPAPPPATARQTPPDIATEKAKPQTPAAKASQPASAAPAKPAHPARHARQAERERELARQDVLKRLSGLAASTSARNPSSGAPNAGAAPGASYAAKVEATIRPNIVFPELHSVSGNPATEVEIRLGADGTILLPPRVLKRSGDDRWDSAVLRGIERTGSLPGDVDGRYPSPLILILRPKQR